MSDELTPVVAVWYWFDGEFLSDEPMSCWELYPGQSWLDADPEPPDGWMAPAGADLAVKARELLGVEVRIAADSVEMMLPDGATRMVRTFDVRGPH